MIKSCAVVTSSPSKDLAQTIGRKMVGQLKTGLIKMCSGKMIKLKLNFMKVCPRDTGELLKDLSTIKRRGKADWKISTNKKYLEALEFGTGIHGPKGAVIYPRRTKVFAIPVEKKKKHGYSEALVREWQGKKYIIISSHEGMKAQPFWEKSMVDFKDDMDKSLQLYFSQLASKLNRGV